MSEQNESKKQSWWQTLPGLLTAIAGVITAITGLVVGLHQAGLFSGKQDIRPPTQESGLATGPGTLSPQESEGGTEADSAAPATVTSPKAQNIPQQTAPQRMNLLSAENGGQLSLATSDQWLKTIDGDESDFAFYESNLRGKTEAVYAFKDQRAARFDTFTVLILDTRDSNIKDFELLWGNESPTGPFTSIGRFRTENVKFFKTPYQEFESTPVTARYLKVRLLSTWKYALIDAREFQLYGTLQ